MLFVLVSRPDGGVLALLDRDRPRPGSRSHRLVRTRSWYHWAHEPCWVIRKPGIPHLFHGSRDQSTIWRAPSPKMIMAGSDEEKQDHPAQKPVLLYEAPIRNHLRPGEAV
jgi:DNA modification methylase